MIVGRRLASIVFPKPGSSDPPLRLERQIVVPTETIDVSAWVEGETGKHPCACGCGVPIKIAPRHHWKGIPAHVPGHHLALMKKEIAAVRAAGQMSAPEVARALGIGGTTLTRLERRLGLAVPRTGKHAIRSYAPEHVETLRTSLGPGGTGAGVSLFYMDEVAKRAECKPHTIAHRRGVDLPTGRWVTHPRRGWVFTADEVEQAVAQIKRWPRLSRRRRTYASPSSTGRT
jgi:hypothetical protein